MLCIEQLFWNFSNGFNLKLWRCSWYVSVSQSLKYPSRKISYINHLKFNFGSITMQDCDYYKNVPNLFSFAASLNGLYYSSFDLTTRWSYSLLASLASEIFQGQQLNKQQQINRFLFTYFKREPIIIEKLCLIKDSKALTV